MRDEYRSLTGSILCILLLIISIWNIDVTRNTAYGSEGPPNIDASGVVLMDAGSGQVIYGKGEDTSVPMASTTKVMTALLVLEQARLDELVTTPQEATEQDGTRVYLETGEYKTVEELLYASMLNSANDAAWALAAHVGQGSVDNFVFLMNRRAQELGALNTHFVNPTGLHEPMHCSTPRDLAMITRQALTNQTFRQIVSTRTSTWVGNQHQTNLYNLNRLLWSYQGITGVKTGYTQKAQNCLIVSAQRDGRELISVILGCGASVWEDSARLLDYGFNNFESKNLIERNQVVAQIELSDGRAVELLTSRGLSVSLPRGSSVNPQTQAQVNERLNAPLPAGSIVGYLTCSVEGEDLEPIPLVTAADLPPERFYPALPALLGSFVGLGGLIYLRGVSRQRKKRNREPLDMRIAARRAKRLERQSRGGYQQ